MDEMIILINLGKEKKESGPWIQMPSSRSSRTNIVVMCLSSDKNYRNVANLTGIVMKLQLLSGTPS